MKEGRKLRSNKENMSLLRKEKEIRRNMARQQEVEEKKKKEQVGPMS
jgi:hypothetical protein